MKQTTWLAIANAVVLGLTIFMNYLANALPLNNQTTGEISDRLNILFTPADYAFSIWGLIYLLLIIWVVMLFVSPQGPKVTNEIGLWFIISCVLNVSWLFFFHYEYFFLSLIVMLMLFYSLLIIYRRLKSDSFWLLWRVPFSIYLAWISVATIINIAVVFNSHHLHLLFTPEAWTVLFIWLSTVWAIWFMYQNTDLIYPMVFIWALVGIAMNRPDLPEIEYSAWAMAAVLSIVLLYHLIPMIKDLYKIKK
ncbi:tryptophan-rich sensory protein [Alkalibacillus haloalkaliphilus]|uniref:Tryptophan-rich sensory protein n=1 Tax=Alkalibacillus haloalkaliphilus TaxID=94136 RepID=A0A511W3B4_9BACI|nr:tryptophan-rich sensory protein [Alkalibacillus haloalkaliphilus]GEN45540.1 hypothetical protein AHA02nite_13160 [Alkalibacillus haloalkaliphilus]